MRPTVVASLLVVATFAAVQVTGAQLDHLYDYTQEPDEQSNRYCATCDKPCGIQPMVQQRRSSFSKIVNGENAYENEFGWAATLSRRGQFYCGGTLITKKHVLTAAHCVENINPKDLTITIGEHNRKYNTIYKSVHYISKINRHPNFKLSTFDNDIAIIELREAVEMENPMVRVACLPRSNNSSYEGVQATVIGWGRLGERKKSSDILQKVDVPIISNEDCKNMGYSSEKITNNMMCAGYNDGEFDACQGDSGGPMHQRLTYSSTMEIIGIVSWGKGCARKNYPGVYTRVANYLDWIMDQTGDECVCGSPTTISY